MHVFQLFLPLYDPAGPRFTADVFHATRDELVERFGGLTMYTRAPATGLWGEEGSTAERDSLVIYEVMVEDYDPAWWSAYKDLLKQRFRQKEMIIRRSVIDLV
jgi:hypothetical protein